MRRQVVPELHDELGEVRLPRRDPVGRKPFVELDLLRGHRLDLDHLVDPGVTCDGRDDGTGLGGVTGPVHDRPARGERGLQALQVLVEVRQRQHAAIDQQKLVRTTVFGKGQVTHSYAPTIASWYRKDAAEYWPWGGGVAQAKKLLAKSGYNGETIEVIAGGPESQQKNAVSIEQDLKAAGIKVKIQRLDHTTYQSRLNSGKFQIASTGTPMRSPADVLYNERYCAHGEQPDPPPAAAGGWVRRSPCTRHRPVPRWWSTTWTPNWPSAPRRTSVPTGTGRSPVVIR